MCANYLKLLQEEPVCDQDAQKLKVLFFYFTPYCAQVLQMLLDLHLPGSKFSTSVQKPQLMHMVAAGLLSACFAVQELLLGHNPNVRPDSELCFDMGKQVSAVSFDTILTRYGRHSLA